MEKYTKFRKSRFKWFLTRNTGLYTLLQAIIDSQQQRIVSLSKNMLFPREIGKLLQWSSLWICKKKKKNLGLSKKVKFGIDDHW